MTKRGVTMNGTLHGGAALGSVNWHIRREGMFSSADIFLPDDAALGHATKCHPADKAASNFTDVLLPDEAAFAHATQEMPPGRFLTAAS